ncbi:response regulator transcription factor [Paenibacillus humicola]|uniref:response regulator transcription factor n=1 Tax=Paenibacillus humicola TaxID=3110540 RepID=UPI00237A5304|nr:response regulator [Paenibacillus humicola]
MNIFIVEDEPWALAELDALFVVYAPEHAVYTFGCAEDALAMARSVRPHLVVTDINMPGMDGLELIGELIRLEPAVKSIILSVHDQFSYAQQGMKIGAFEYLLKPVRKDVLYQAVDKAIDKIARESKRQEERRCWAVAQMLLASAPPGDEEAAEIFGGAHAMAVLQAGNGAGERGWNEAGIANQEIAGWIGDELQGITAHCVSIDARRKAVLVPGGGGLRDMEKIGAAFAVLFDHLVRRGLILHLAYALKPEREDPHRCFAALNKSIEERMFFGRPTLIPPGGQQRQADLSAVWDKVRILQTHLKQGDLSKSGDMLGRIVQELRSREITSRQLALFVTDLFYSLKYNLGSSSRTEIDIGKLQEDLKALSRLSGFDELAEWLKERVVGLLSAAQLTDLSPKGLIPVMRNWIHAGYQHELSIQQFAADHHVSLGYLSRLFKSQTGCTFSDYLIRYRIEKAKELLAEGSARLSDVSRLVGYEDVKHFSQLFKKITGEPPIAYAKRMHPNR